MQYLVYTIDLLGSFVIFEIFCFMCQVREYAILLNLGSLRAIAMKECVLIFDYNRYGCVLLLFLNSLTKYPVN